LSSAAKQCTRTSLPLRGAASLSALDATSMSAISKDQIANIKQIEFIKKERNMELKRLEYYILRDEVAHRKLEEQ
jgi:hypothetical protein